MEFKLNSLFCLLKIVLMNLIFLKDIKIIKCNSEIHLLIEGTGLKYILNSDFYPKPSEVEINAQQKSLNLNNLYYLEKDLNNIKLKFNQEIASCEYMFNDLDYILEIDLSKFVFSKVKNLKRMFSNCLNLENINFGNIDTSLVENKEKMFYSCSKLTSVDLSKFDTTKVTTMESMFKDCFSLKYLNLYSFNIKISTVNINNIFDGISPKAEYCINDIKTRNYLLGNNKIINCENNFKTNKRKIEIICFKYRYNDKCIDECPSDTFAIEYKVLTVAVKHCIDYIPKSYESEDGNVKKYKCFICTDCKDDIDKFIFIYNLQYLPYNENKYHNYFFDENYGQQCIKFCTGVYNKLVPNNKECVDKCKNIKEYMYEYKNICYNKCPDKTYILEDNQDYICYSEAPDGYYLDKSAKKFKKCYEACSKCNEKGDIILHNCNECKEGLKFYLNISNCYPICSKYYYLDNLKEFHCTELCPEEYNNTCYINCPNGTYEIEDNQDKICYDINLDGYYLDIYKLKYIKCFETCNKCDIGGNISNHNCLDCKDNYTFYNNLMNISNCYKECNNYYYFDESNNFYCTEECKEEYNKLIID